MHIYILRESAYVEVLESPTFPGLPLREVIPQYLAQSSRAGRNATLKAWRRWVRDAQG